MTLGTAVLPGLVLILSPNSFALGLGETVLAILGGGVGWLLALVITDHPLKDELLAVWRMIGAAAGSRGLVRGAPAE